MVLSLMASMPLPGRRDRGAAAGAERSDGDVDGDGGDGGDGGGEGVEGREGAQQLDALDVNANDAEAG